MSDNFNERIESNTELLGDLVEKIAKLDTNLHRTLNRIQALEWMERRIDVMGEEADKLNGRVDHLVVLLDRMDPAEIDITSLSRRVGGLEDRVEILEDPRDGIPEPEGDEKYRGKRYSVSVFTDKKVRLRELAFTYVEGDTVVYYELGSGRPGIMHSFHMDDLPCGSVLGAVWKFQERNIHLLTSGSEEDRVEIIRFILAASGLLAEESDG